MTRFLLPHDHICPTCGGQVTGFQWRDLFEMKLLFLMPCNHLAPEMDNHQKEL